MENEVYYFRTESGTMYKLVINKQEKYIETLALDKHKFSSFGVKKPVTKLADVELLKIGRSGGKFILRLGEKTEEITADITEIWQEEDFWDQKIKLEYVCEVCGKTEVIDPQTAFKNGWDYPPRMGEFGIFGPRTCGNCGIDQTLYWKLAAGKITASELTEEDHRLISRILTEPASLLPK